MSTAGFVAPPLTLLDELRAAAGADHVVTTPAGVETLSKDYYWYSPVLRARLDDRVAGAAVKIADLATLKQVVSSLVRARVPITLRGAATGNYGQCVPLYGGVVLDLSGLDRVKTLSDDGVVTTEPGARLATIENLARPRGWELRCYPSTWVKASVGGFLGGGSGGIGSIAWGGLRDLGTIKRLTLLTIEEAPRTLVLDEAETMQAFHAYGTNGIMIEIELRLAPARAWDQLVVAGRDWDRIFAFTNELAADESVRKRLVTLLEDPIPSFFKPIRKLYPPDHHLIFLEVESCSTAEVRQRAAAAGLEVCHTIPHHEPRRSPMLSDYTWNHTTLWALKADPGFTYLQSGFGDDAAGKIRRLRARFPGEILFHLEWVKGNSKMGLFGQVTCGGIPLVRFRDEARLREIIDACTELGVFTANPHTCYVEEGGRDFGFEAQHALKAQADPHGLLNPGKLKHYPHNPFAAPGAMPAFLFA